MTTINAEIQESAEKTLDAAPRSASSLTTGVRMIEDLSAFSVFSALIVVVGGRDPAWTRH
jgi:hypothetical protein